MIAAGCLWCEKLSLRSAPSAGQASQKTAVKLRDGRAGLTAAAAAARVSDAERRVTGRAERAEIDRSRTHDQTSGAAVAESHRVCLIALQRSSLRQSHATPRLTIQLEGQLKRRG